LNDHRDLLFLFKYPNAIYYIVDLNFLFIQIHNDGEDLIRVFKGRLGFIKEFMEIEYHYVDPESHDFVILRNINSESHSRPPIIKKHDILITHDINIYRNTCP
jgi:hypothetical protein